MDFIAFNWSVFFLLLGIIGIRLTYHNAQFGQIIAIIFDF